MQTSEETRPSPPGLAVRPLITVFNTISAIVSAAPPTAEDILILRIPAEEGVHSALNNPRQPFLRRVIPLGIACGLAGFAADTDPRDAGARASAGQQGRGWSSREGDEPSARTDEGARLTRPLRHRENREAVSTAEGCFLPVMDYRGISQYS